MMRSIRSRVVGGMVLLIGLVLATMVALRVVSAARATEGLQ